MRNELKDIELEEVTGGNVTLSASLNMVYFTSVDKACQLNPGVEFTDVRDCLLALYDANMDMSDNDFDMLVRSEFRARGYI